MCTMTSISHQIGDKQQPHVRVEAHVFELHEPVLQYQRRRYRQDGRGIGRLGQRLGHDTSDHAADNPRRCRVVEEHPEPVHERTQRLQMGYWLSINLSKVASDEGSDGLRETIDVHDGSKKERGGAVGGRRVNG